MATKKRKKKAKTRVAAAPKAHTIHILVSNNGVITYKHTPGNDDGTHVSVEPSDTVKWRCPGHAFTVLFSKNGSPFDTVVFGGLDGGTSNDGLVLPGPGTYSYLVVVVNNNGLLPDDPDIIVT